MEHGDRKSNHVYDHDFDLIQLQKDKKQIIQELRLNRIINMYAKVPGNVKKAETSTTLNNTDSDQDHQETIGSESPKRKISLMTDYARKEANRNMNTPIAELRARYLLEVKAAYQEHYEAGLMAPESYLILINSISDGLDRCDEELHDWKYLHGLLKYGFMF